MARVGVGGTGNVVTLPPGNDGNLTLPPVTISAPDPD
jgi:hypothetical protein